MLQAAGETLYTPDIPSFPGQLNVAFILTTIGNATIDKIDASEALVSSFATFGQAHMVTFMH